MEERSNRVGEATAEVGADFAVLTSPDTVCYASGHVVPIEAGPSPFAGGPDTAIVARDGTVAVIIPNLEEDAARAGYADHVITYEGFTNQRQDPVVDNYLSAVDEAFAALDVGGILAIEPNSFPANVRDELQQRGGSFVDIRQDLDRARATKTDEELRLLRRCAELTGLGQDATVQQVQAGRTELEIFADVRTAWELAEGERLAVTGDFISGVQRTSQVTGWPTDRLVKEGEPVIADLAPRASGYWGDSCNTLFVGEATDDFMELYRLVQHALEHAVETLRPGISASAFDAEVRGVINNGGYDYPHHTGHGIGTSVHEFPRLVPEEGAVLQPNMVLLVEPGAYDPDIGGVRLEWMFRVTENGAERLSPFEHVLRPQGSRA